MVPTEPLRRIPFRRTLRSLSLRTLRRPGFTIPSLRTLRRPGLTRFRGLRRRLRLTLRRPRLQLHCQPRMTLKLHRPGLETLRIRKLPLRRTLRRPGLGVKRLTKGITKLGTRSPLRPPGLQLHRQLRLVVSNPLAVLVAISNSLARVAAAASKHLARVAARNNPLTRVAAAASKPLTRVTAVSNPLATIPATLKHGQCLTVVFHYYSVACVF